MAPDRAKIVREFAAKYEIPHGIAERGVDVGVVAAERAWSEFAKFIALEHDSDAKLVAAHVFFVSMQGALAERLILSELLMAGLAARHRQQGGADAAAPAG